MKSRRFQILPVLKSVFKKLRFRDGLMWRVSLTVKSKLRFQFLQRTEDAVLTRLRIKLTNLAEKHIKMLFYTLCLKPTKQGLKTHKY